jgi:formylglycine-generating enzyme required for sulfatase activity
MVGKPDRAKRRNSWKVLGLALEAIHPVMTVNLYAKRETTATAGRGLLTKWKYRVRARAGALTGYYCKRPAVPVWQRERGLMRMGRDP